MGASRRSKASPHATTAASSPPNPPVTGASCTISTRPVLVTDAMMVCVSSGLSVRGSITSSSMPSFSRIAAASRARGTMMEMAITVKCRPGRLTSALARGIVYRSSGTGPLVRYKSLCSMKTTGLLSRMAEMSSPLAS